MHLPRMSLDPERYYERLGVDPSATPETIVVAYRRMARLVHPDVPGTGDSKAFVDLKQAYDVLVHAERRAAYDRLARQPAPPESELGEIGPLPFPEMSVMPTRHPRWHDLPIAVWTGMAVMLMVGAIEIGLHLRGSPRQVKREAIPANARDVPPPLSDEPAPAVYGPAPVRLAGTPNFYITPTVNPAVLWRADDARHALVPWGQLPPFSAVQGLRLLKPSGMVEVRVTDNTNGFIEAGRLTPGDTAAAARAWCTFHAGPAPANGEVLTHFGEGAGKATLTVDNRSGQPAVVKIRSTQGTVVASVFLSPGGQTTIEGMPEEQVRLDFATGEAWSRACHGFEASMRAQRFSSLVAIGTLKQLAIPPEPHIATVELADSAFEQE
jgi:hypothetical protein